MTPDRSLVEVPRSTRILMLCDWLPPDFGAVGQYAVGFATDLALAGHDVALVGFSSRASGCVDQPMGDGRLRVRQVYRPTYDRANLLSRAWWTLGANVALLWGARRELWRCDEVRFTGSPPYLLHFIMPLALALRIRTRYRITDFHPECLVAALGRNPWWLRVMGQITRFWRRRVDVVEVLGDDQGRRLKDSGVAMSRVVLVRDSSPVDVRPDGAAAHPPAEAQGRRIILYSGNWGVAHEHATFVEGYRRFSTANPGLAWLWLNATGKRAGRVAAELGSMGLPFGLTPPAPLDRLAGILCAADIHLITLENAFVGYVLPSKVYACIASGRAILFVGSEASDVHALCLGSLPVDRYRRVDVGDPAGVESALAFLIGTSGQREAGSGMVSRNGGER